MSALLRSSKRRYIEREFVKNCFNSAKNWECANRVLGRPRKRYIDDLTDKTFMRVKQKKRSDFDTFLLALPGHSRLVCANQNGMCGTFSQETGYIKVIKYLHLKQSIYSKAMLTR